MFSLICSAQKENTIKRDSSTFMLSTFRLNSDKQTPYFSSTTPYYSYDFKSTTRFTIYSDSFNNRNVLYDNFRHEYINNDVLQPYSNFGSALIGGALNYLIILLDKKR